MGVIGIGVGTATLGRICRDKDGKSTARCGNAVPPPFAAALVRANLPEWCAGVEINTMEELERAVAV